MIATGRESESFSFPVVAGSARDPITDQSLTDQSLARRVTLIWALLFFNGLPFFGGGSLLPIPPRLAQLITAGALGLALLLALALNPRMLLRPNVVLLLASLLAIVALITGIRGEAGSGAILRGMRLSAFLLTLWLLTPLWGRSDLLLARCHLRALVGVSATVVAGALLAPSIALEGRLAGIIWPVPPTQVAAFAALAAGMGILLWLSGHMSRGHALVLGGGGVILILLTQTRTALVGLVIGLCIAGLTMFLSLRRVRHTLAVLLLTAPIATVVLAPMLLSYLSRNQSPEQLRGLTGRKAVWESLLSSSRSEFNQWFGFGLSDKSFGGRPIDSTWLAVYQDQGLLGVGLVAGLFLFLLIALAFLPPSPCRPLAYFLVIYCLCASYTEVGLGDASPYLLHIVAAASLLVAGARAPAVSPQRQTRLPAAPSSPAQPWMWRTTPT